MYGVHLILRLSAVQTGKRFSCSYGILYAFDAIASMPAFVQTVSQDGSAMDASVASKKLPALGSVRE